MGVVHSRRAYEDTGARAAGAGRGRAVLDRISRGSALLHGDDGWGAALREYTAGFEAGLGAAAEVAGLRAAKRIRALPHVIVPRTPR